MTDSKTEEQARHRHDAVALATRHALFWLLVGNGVGLLLATLLVVPTLASALGVLTYGRWTSVHLMVQLYGWCSLPMVAGLFHLFLPEGVRGARLAQVALGAWTAALAFGAAWVLLGHNSGKLFLEWTGPAGWVLLAMFVMLEAVLAVGYRQRLRTTREPTAARVAKILLLLLLLGVPLAFAVALSPTVYPPVNPNSGGATGTSLLGSSLGFVSVMVFLPLLLGRPRRGPLGPTRRNAALLFCHWVAFTLLGHGDASHLDPTQIIGLGSLVIWWPLLASQWRGFEWPKPVGPWLRWLAFWAAVLLVSAVVLFLPGVLDRLKFTNALVAHAHLAMGGFITALGFSLLVVLQSPNNRSLRQALNARTLVWAWNGGLALMLIALTALGWLESLDPGRLFRPDLWSQLLYLARWTSGVILVGATWRWWTASTLTARREDERREASLPMTRLAPPCADAATGASS